MSASMPDPGTTIAVMQPYLFPYLGYFQLIDAVDTFVMYDDVAYIKGGWINRNTILAAGRRQLFTVPVHGASPHRTIREVTASDDPHWRGKLLRTFEQVYSRAPFFEPVFRMVEAVFADAEGDSIADLSARSIVSVVAFLGIGTRIITSSTIDGDSDRRGVDRLLHLCRIQGARTLVNPEGGKDLYSKERFRREGIDLVFLTMRDVVYRQLQGHSFVPRLSIIDVLMFNGRTGTRELLGEYDLE